MKKIRCAIYTRKSAEEGLEQEWCLRCLLLVMCTHPLCKKGAYASFSA